MYISNQNFFINRRGGILSVPINFGYWVIFTQLLNNEQCHGVFNVSDCIGIHKLFFRVEMENLLLINGAAFGFFLTLQMANNGKTNKWNTSLQTCGQKTLTSVYIPWLITNEMSCVNDYKNMKLLDNYDRINGKQSSGENFF